MRAVKRPLAFLQKIFILINMYQFIWPFVLILLPLPFVVRWVLSSVPDSVSAEALKVPFFDRLQKLNLTQKGNRRSVSSLLWTLTWISFVLAAARPVWVGKPVQLDKEARNIMLTLDVSGSMEEEDFDVRGRPLTRLQMVKMLAKDFIEKRQGDNLGLVIFGTEAYTYAPLSPDAKTLKGLMDEIGVGIAGGQTAMGDALAMAVQAVAAVPEKTRIVILMSDGFANAGVISVEEALKLAKDSNVKVYTIGIGSDKQMVQDFFGFVQMNASLDLDEASLQKIAEETGGQYFRAKSTSELQKIYTLIDELETTKTEEKMVRPQREMAYLFILAGLFCWLVAFVKRRMA